MKPGDDSRLRHDFRGSRDRPGWSGADNRAVGLDLGADDAVSRPWDATELLARTRVQLRALRADKQLLEQMRIATEGQQIAHTAFDALAVTERMASNADSLDKR